MASDLDNVIQAVSEAQSRVKATERALRKERSGSAKHAALQSELKAVTLDEERRYAVMMQLLNAQSAKDHAASMAIINTNRCAHGYMFGNGCRACHPRPAVWV